MTTQKKVLRRSHVPVMMVRLPEEVREEEDAYPIAARPSNPINRQAHQIPARTSCPQGCGSPSSFQDSNAI